MVSRPVAEGLFEWPAVEARLLSGRCADCGTYTFPAPDGCPRCSSTDIRIEPLPSRGTLWSFTVQRFKPKSPFDGADPFVPYGVGYVEFEGQVIVEGRLTEADPERLRIGQQMKVCLVPYSIDPDGNDVVTYAFAPADK